MKLTSPDEHIKNTSTCGTTVTENWKLAEGLLYNQGSKKDTQVIRWEGKKSNRTGTCASGRGLRGKGEYTGGHPPWGVNGWNHRLGTPVLGSYLEEKRPLGWLEDC